MLLKAACPELGIVCDVALDPYTDHGHDGMLDEQGRIVNDGTVDKLVQQARILAAAGCDIIAPSDMMDGRVGAIRSMLETDGYADIDYFVLCRKICFCLLWPF